MFKVVADQLKVAQGWVRCGQCGAVFEASLYLVEQAAGTGASATGHDLTPAIDPAATTQAPLRTLTPPPLSDEPAENPGAALASPPFPTTETSESVRDLPVQQDESGPGAAGQADAQPVPQAVEIRGDAQPAETLPAHASPEIEQLEDSLFPEAREDPADVSFVREASRKSFWKTPLVRSVLGLVLLLLLLVLALQWMARQKDVLAAQEPRLAPLLQALCRPLGCEIRPLRRIESVLIDSANFSKTGPDAYRLTFVLKNTGAAALEIPALEVTLTDSQDQALVRRVLLPAQFGVTAVTLAAYSELAGAVSLKVAGDGSAPQAAPLPVAGYRILAFYP